MNKNNTCIKETTILLVGEIAVSALVVLGYLVAKLSFFGDVQLWKAVTGTLLGTVVTVGNFFFLSPEHNGKYWKNKHLTQEMIDKISKTKMGSIPWNKDIPHTEETKNKISKKAKTRLAIKENNPMFGKLGKDNPNSEIIYCIELQQEFIGIREAARELGLNFPNIIRSLKSNGKYSGGSLPNIGKTHWIYKENEENENNRCRVQEDGT